MNIQEQLSELHSLTRPRSPERSDGLGELRTTWETVRNLEWRGARPYAPLPMNFSFILATTALVCCSVRWL